MVLRGLLMNAKKGLTQNVSGNLKGLEGTVSKVLKEKEENAIEN